MVSFFDKLKKGMGTEVEMEEPEIKEEEKAEKKPAILATNGTARKKKKIEVKTSFVKKEIDKAKKTEEPEKNILEERPESSRRDFNLQNLGGQEGQLTVDVYQTQDDLVIQSAIAGVKSEDLDISIEADSVLIRGRRVEPPEGEKKNYFYQECFWGPFSRQIILPEETDPSRAAAEIKEGILTIRIPKIERKKKRKITVKED
jgi:HSP20 family molecular chaperone IbpA